MRCSGNCKSGDHKQQMAECFDTVTRNIKQKLEVVWHRVVIPGLGIEASSSGVLGKPELTLKPCLITVNTIIAFSKSTEYVQKCMGKHTNKVCQSPNETLFQSLKLFFVDEINLKTNNNGQNHMGRQELIARLKEL